MIARDNFAADVKWYTGAGCIICGSNYSQQGADAGIQAIDFEMDDIQGRIGICYSHAREIGVLVGMVDKRHLDEVMETATKTYEQSGELRVEAENLRNEAAADRAVVERLLAGQAVVPVEAPVEPEVVPEDAPKRRGRPPKAPVTE